MKVSIKRPVNWNYIQDLRKNDWKLMKGDFGELIVKELLEKKGITLERMEKWGAGLPDFKVKGHSAMIEVKSHKNTNKGDIPSKPPVWQRNHFIPLIKMGWKIFVAHPQLFLNGDKSEVICNEINWYAFTDIGKVLNLENSPF